MVDLTFMNINSLFVFSFKNGDNDLTRDSFDKYRSLLVEIEDYFTLIDKKTFF